MIISCSNCNKKFNINEKMIPENGRLLQCSICNHKWHYKIPKYENLTEEKEILINPTLVDRSINEIKIKSDVNSLKKLKTQKQEIDIDKKIIKKKNSMMNALSTILIIIILFVTIILCLDTFKGNFGNHFTVLTPFLESLYETLFDIKSFIKDLIS